MLKLSSEFVAAVCCRLNLNCLAAFLVAFAAICVPMARAQYEPRISLTDGGGNTASAECPGTTVYVTVTTDCEDGGLESSGNWTISISKGSVLTGSFVMPDSGDVCIEAWDSCSNYNSATAANLSDVPAQTNVTPVAGSIISNGWLSPTDFLLCAAGSSVSPPQDDGTSVIGTNITVIYSSCGNLISSNPIPVPYNREPPSLLG
jgi:hypothetical protein